jgi:putative ABC transport system permease protein
VGGLSRYALRSLAARPLRSFLTVAGIALGVAVLFAALATNAGIDAAIERTARDMIGRADLRVEGFAQGGLSPASVEAIAGTPGVAVIAPRLERRTYLGPDPSRPTDPSAPVTVLGIDTLTDSRLHDLALASGVALTEADGSSALITEQMARATGLALGDTVTLQGVDVPRTERIVGIVVGDGPIAGVAGRTVIVSIAQAQALFGTSSATRVDLGLAVGARSDAVSVDLERRLTAEPYVLSTPADLAASLRTSTVDFQATTALIAALAVFGGAFLIFNTLSMTVAERAREVGLLRAAGATRRQVIQLVLGQALVLGLAGSALGVLIGIVLAALIAWYVKFSSLVPIASTTVPPAAVGLAVAVGLLVTLAAAIEPAIRAGRIPPIEALRPSLSIRTVGARLRWLIVVFLVVAVVGVLLGPRAAGPAGVVRWLAVYGVLLIATLLTPFLLRPLGRLAGIPFALIAPVAERLSRGSLLRDRSRTTLTVGALTVGLAMIVALGGVSQDARRVATAWLTSVVPGEVIATSIRPVAPDEGVAAQLAAVPGVSRVSPIATFQAAFRGRRLDAAAVVGADLLADGRLTFVDGDRTAALTGLDAGGVTILPQSLSRLLGLRVGDDMAFPVGGGREVTLRVVGIVERAIPGKTGETLLVGWSDATTGFGVAGADVFAIRYAPGAAASAGPELERTARSLALELSPLDRIAGAVDDALARVFGLFDALALIAIFVAALGIVNTLSMGVYERVRELGVLRATGMTRRQVWRMVIVEAGILGIVGAIIGCATGIVVGQVMIGLAGGGSLQLPFELDWRTILVTAVFGIVIAMLAAIWPARLASRMPIVRAVQFE